MLSKRTKKIALALAGITVALATFGAVVLGGAVTVAATDAHYAPVQWVLETTMESSIQAHAADVEVPAGLDLDDPELAQRAFGHYDVACTPCHGAPGIEPAPWLWLNPPAEPLVESADRWSDSELYWIIRNGIKMTGMPALGPTHEDADLWAIAAMVRQLPKMSAEEYQRMAKRHHATHAAAGHEHEAEPPPDSMPEGVGGQAQLAGRAEEPSPAEVEPDPVPQPVRRTTAKAKRSSARSPREAAKAAGDAAPPPPPQPPPASGGHEHHHHH